MSCLSSTAPIDIDAEKQSGTCDLKCNYQFRYSDSISTATNRGDYISINYEPTSSAPPVRFNAYEYSVSEMRIYTPSLHTYNDTKAAGECVIVHTSSSGNYPLLVCVPIGVGDSASKASQYLSNVIKTMSKTAPVDKDSTQIPQSFNLDDFVPSKPFYSYTGTQPYQPCQGKNNYVVFTPSDSACSVSSQVLETLRSVIQENAYTTNTSTPFFYNSAGPGQSLNFGNDDIYIDCQPVGESEETIDVLNDNNNNNGDDNTIDLFQGEIWKYFIIFLVFLAIVYTFNYFLNYLAVSIKHLETK